MGLQPGESASISADLDCSSDLDRTVEVAITAAGSGQSVDLTRSVEVSCTSSEEGETMAERTQVMSAEAIGDDGSIVEFTLETDGSGEVVLTGLGIDQTEDGDAEQVTTPGKSEREVEFDGGGFLELGNDAIKFGAPPKDFEEDGDDGAYETIAGGETTTGTLQEFLSEGPGRSGGPVNMGGTTLEITLEFQDQSNGTYTVEVS